MKKFLIGFFAILGVIFFVLIVGVAVFFITDPYDLKPLITTFWNASTTSEPGEIPEGDRNALLSEGQEEALKSIGVDPAGLPSEITPEMEACFEEKLGSERTAEIKAGSEPTAADYFTARSCFE